MPRLVRLVLLLLLFVRPAAAGEEDAILARHGFSPAALGYVLFDPDSGAAVAARQPDRPFAPASVAKVPTVAAALAILGPEHRFFTRLHVTGPVRDGIVRGDLILEGGGDPALTTEGLVWLADELRIRGIAGVSGRFLFDATALPELPEIDGGQPWTAGYNTGVGALSLNYNRFQLVRTPALGAWAVADAGRYPIDSIRLDGAAAGVAPVEPAGPDRWRVSAAGPARVWLPVTRPGLAAASVFRRVAAERGVVLPAPVPGKVPANANPVAGLMGPPLADLARQILRYSNNLSAELVGLSAARRLDPAVADLKRSAAVLQDWLTRGVPSANWRGMRLLNHSGLTSASRITPRQMAILLRAAGPAVWDLLPGEEDGLSLPPGVRAKSGTIAYAKSLTGLLTAADGRRLGFALFIGDEEARNALDRAMDRRIAEMPAEARDWLARARAVQTDLLALWSAAR